MASFILAVFRLALAFHLSTAQIFVINNQAVPPGRSIQSIHNFPVYSEEDSPDRSLGSPFIRFQDFEAHLTSPKDAGSVKDYRGLQISILPVKDLSGIIDVSHYCSDEADVAYGKAKQPDTLLVREVADLNMTNIRLGVYNILLQADSTGALVTPALQVPILQTGVYSILISNCGNIPVGMVKGSIIIRNSYGYLPGSEYRNLPFYKGLSVVYLALSLLWTSLSIKGWSGLLKIYSVLGGVLLSSLVEAAIWVASLTAWNNTGLRPANLHMLALFASAFTSVGSYMLALLAALGWGVTRSHLENGTAAKAFVLCSLLIVADFVHDHVMSFRSTLPAHQVTMIVAFVSWAPVALLNCTLFMWIVWALTQNIDMMRERKQEEKLLLFTRLWRVLALSVSLASITVIVQMCVMTTSLELRWRSQWFFSGAGPHVLLASVLISMMYLWAPTDGNRRYAYTHVANDEAETQIEEAEHNAPAVAGDTVWAVDEEDDVFGEDNEEAEDDTFWDATKVNNNKVAPEPDLIGLSVDGT